MNRASLTIALLATVSLAGAARAGVTVTYEAPGVENTTATLTGAQGVETFNSLSPGLQSFTSNFGTPGGAITGQYSDVTIRTADEFGGAGGTNFASADSNDPITLTLTDTNNSGGVTYFGFWLSALDAGNFLTLSENGTQIFSFDPTTVLNAIGGNPAYFGNPSDGGADGGEPFVFVNFFSTTTFNQVTFTETIPGNGYESDNHTVAEGFNQIVGTPVGLPEPASWALMIAGFGGVGAMLRHRQRSAAFA